MLIAIKDLLPNPFRRIEHYPIRREKVDALKESYRKTGVWPVIMGRWADGKQKKVEIAYGHHRKAAAEEYAEELKKPNFQIEVHIRDLSDEAMLQIMARENMEEWETNALVEIETVQSVVEAYAQGKVKLPALRHTTDSSLRYAPSFLPGKARLNEAELPYTAQTIGEFLGWLKRGTGDVQDKVKTALTALQYLEEGLITFDRFKEVSIKGVEAIIIEARQARESQERLARLMAQDAARAKKEAEKKEREEREAREEADRLWRKQKDEEAQEAERRQARAARERAEYEAQAKEKQRREEEYRKKGREAVTTVTKAATNAVIHEKKGADRERAREAAQRAFPEHKRTAPPQIHEYLRDLKMQIGKFLLHGRDPLAEKLATVLKYKDGLDEDELVDTVKTFQILIERAEYYIKAFSPETQKEKVVNNAQSLLKR